MKIYVNNIFKVKKQKENKKEGQVYKVDSFEENLKENEEIVIQKKEIETVLEDKTNISKNTYIRKGAANNNLKLNIKDKISKNAYKIESKNNKKQSMPKSYYALLVLMVGLAGVSIKLVKDTNEQFTFEEDYAVFNSKDDDYDILDEDINENYLQNQKSSNIDTRQEIEEVSSVSSNNVLNQVQEKINTIVEKKEEPLVFTKPHNGEISKIYSDDKVIYSKTLEMWKTHDGIDIKGNIGDIVYSVERGKVEKIYEDAFYGVTIVIDHGQGYKTSYSNLSEDTFVDEGDTIKKSQKIGKIGATAIGEIKDNPHLHFMLYKNNVVADPSSIF